MPTMISSKVTKPRATGAPSTTIPKPTPSVQASALQSHVDGNFENAILALHADPDNQAPCDVALSSFLRIAGFEYSDLSMLAVREYFVDPTAEVLVRCPRVRLILAKGKFCLEKIFVPDRYKPLQESGCNGYEAVLQFYEEVFGKDPGITPVLDDPDAWHLILVGYRRALPAEEKELGAKFNPWCILSACSFSEYADIKILYLRWLAVHLKEKAIYERWNNKRSTVSSEKEKYFNNKPLSNGKGIGTTMVASAQWICSVISEADRAPFSIIVQSSMDASSFYSFGLGMTKVTNDELIPPEIADKLLVTPDLITMRLDGSVLELRPPNISEIPFSFGDIWSTGLRHYLETMTASKLALPPNASFDVPHPRYNDGSFIYNMKKLTIKEHSKLKWVFEGQKELSSGTKYGFNGRLNTKDQEYLFHHHFPSTAQDSCLIVVPQEICGLFLTRMLIHNHFLNGAKEQSLFL